MFDWKTALISAAIAWGPLVFWGAFRIVTAWGKARAARTPRKTDDAVWHAISETVEDFDPGK